MSDICKDIEASYNANLLKQNGINLKHVYNDHINTDMSYENFCEVCRCCWQQKWICSQIKTVCLRMNDTEKDLINMRYFNMISRCQLYNISFRVQHE